MKLKSLSRDQAAALVVELRAMAELPMGPNPAALRRAKEIRFQLQGQDFATPTSIEKADEVYRGLEVFLHATRWRQKSSIEGLRAELRSAVARLRAHLGLESRPSV